MLNPALRGNSQIWRRRSHTPPFWCTLPERLPRFWLFFRLSAFFFYYFNDECRTRFYKSPRSDSCSILWDFPREATDCVVRMEPTSRPAEIHACALWLSPRGLHVLRGKAWVSLKLWAQNFTILIAICKYIRDTWSYFCHIRQIAGWGAFQTTVYIKPL